ncbi:glycine cleavage system protein GcvH [Tropicimonas sp. TH_r6]|uniref:glycine cleavage system protein GcvH n=1 Tax=Tropicimonas sp. TH_r6 TaxID=3082085 RepID=UPI0029546756|nr:glycine cleavage system protein GcvH [Tropicimonas sp. TH_r6]MDV7142382.1 glycine cleavage system protein GcvH [Tropicimonas sp. TH_r6]
MKFTEDHEWLSLDGDVVTVGITDHAQEQLGDIVYIELPEIGTQVSKDDEVVVIESVKAASDIAAPIDGEVVEINETIIDAPDKVNADAEGAAWFFKVKIDDAGQLDEYMDETAYKDLIA